VRPDKWIGPAFDFPSTLEAAVGAPNEMLFAKIIPRHPFPTRK
jgi:hypothetical protein